jgi:hypothetical protein
MLTDKNSILDRLIFWITRESHTFGIWEWGLIALVILIIAVYFVPVLLDRWLKSVNGIKGGDSRKTAKDNSAHKLEAPVKLEAISLVKTKPIVHFALVVNGEMPYSARMMYGFVEEAEDLLEKNDYIGNFVRAWGSPENGVEGDKYNERVFNELLKKFTQGSRPDYLVTFGTQVSVFGKAYAKRTKMGCHQIFVGVTDPIISNLVTSLNSPRTENISGTCYGDLYERSRLIVDLFKGKSKLGFVYNPSLTQDEDTYQKTSISFLKTPDAPKLIPITTGEPGLTPAQLEMADAFFGWSYLNQRFDSFASTSDKPFVGVSHEDAVHFAVASVCPDEKELGRRAVREVLAPNLLQNEPLRDIPVVPPVINLQYLNTDLVRRYALKIPSSWKTPNVIHIDLRR